MALVWSAAAGAAARGTAALLLVVPPDRRQAAAHRSGSSRSRQAAAARAGRRIGCRNPRTLKQRRKESSTMAAAASFRGEEMSRMSRLRGGGSQAALGSQGGMGTHAAGAACGRAHPGASTRLAGRQSRPQAQQAAARSRNTQPQPPAGLPQGAHEVCLTRRPPLRRQHRILHRPLHLVGRPGALLVQLFWGAWEGGEHSGVEQSKRAGDGAEAQAGQHSSQQRLAPPRAARPTSCSAPKVDRSPRLKLLFFRLQEAQTRELQRAAARSSRRPPPPPSPPPLTCAGPSRSPCCCCGASRLRGQRSGPWAST